MLSHPLGTTAPWESVAEQAPPLPSGWSARGAPRLLGAALAGTAILIVVGWLLLVALHADDDYRVTHNQGIWVAAADAARGGRMYAPLFDGEHYAGTRYMPVPILINAAAGAVAGDAVTGGKIAAAAQMAVLLSLALLVLRHSGCPGPIAAALCAGIVATDAGLLAGTTVGGDLTPAVLQLAALMVAMKGGGWHSMTAAGSLAGLALASKLTGVWGALAIATWLLLRRRMRSAVVFGGTCLLTAGAVLAVVEVWTGGGLSAHLLTFSTAGIQGGATAWLRAPNQLLFQLTGHAVGTMVLAPFACLGLFLTGGRSQPALVPIALAYALCAVLVAYSDIGTGFNQLLDVAVLTALSVGVVAGTAPVRLLTGPMGGRDLSAAIALTVLWAAGLDLVRTVGRDVRLSVASVLAGDADARAVDRVAAMVGPGETVLAEDPSVEVALGRTPRIMDPFMLARLDRRYPERVDPLIASIAARRFDVVVLVQPLENPELDFWWTDFHLGPRIAHALRGAYQRDARVGRFFVYRPAR